VIGPRLSRKSSCHLAVEAKWWPTNLRMRPNNVLEQTGLKRSFSCGRVWTCCSAPNR
jgi:hypothetical protein